jgi:hypothetical protein
MTALLLGLLLVPGSLWADYQRKSSEETGVRRGERNLAEVLRAPEGRRYARTEDGRVLFSPNRGRSWVDRSSGLPARQVWPFESEEPRACTAVAVDHTNWRRVAATTKKHLFLSSDAGRSWRRIPLRDPVRSSNYLTSVCIDPDAPQTIYLGTSFNGVYVSRDGGQNWKKISEHLTPLYRGAGFYEEISDLTVSPGEPGVLYLMSRFERSLYRYDIRSRTVSQLPFPDSAAAFYAVSGRSDGSAPVELHGGERRYVYRPSAGEWQERPALLRPSVVLEDEEGRSAEKGAGNSAAERRAAAQGGAGNPPAYAGRKGIYLNSWNAAGASLERHLDFMERHGFDTIVVDVKDDWGKLTYRSQLPAARRYGAVRGNLDLEHLIEAAHARGFYVVGRMVVFKDKELYHARDGELAVWNARTAEPWGHEVEEKDPETGEVSMVQREFWVDPFSEEVWDYNIAIAEELEEKGLDEVQFDYIRFPSDGNLMTASYRHRRPGMLKTEAIESFLKKASERIELPISTDLYGFNSWYRMGNWIGQDIEMISRYADVICPMYYPSHFPSSFLPGDDYLRRAYTLYKIGTERARHLVEGRSVIRPYVQAFRVGHELQMKEDAYYRYLSLQLKGIADAEGSGYTLWNNANRYYMVNGSISVLNGASRDGTVQRRMAGP